jgi:hypothetical protein
MGYSSSFFVEAMVFELLAVDWSFVLRIVERSGGVSRAVLLGKVSVGWLLGIVEALLWGGEGRIREILQGWE